jgi:uncharacterized membrane protein YgcG
MSGNFPRKSVPFVKQSVPFVKQKEGLGALSGKTPGNLGTINRRYDPDAGLIYGAMIGYIAASAMQDCSSDSSSDSQPASSDSSFSGGGGDFGGGGSDSKFE